MVRASAGWVIPFLKHSFLRFLSTFPHLTFSIYEQDVEHQISDGFGRRLEQP
jgi:hypothetical protein